MSTFLSGEGHNLDYDQECFTRANVAYSRATDLTILACPLNMQGMPGALQVLAALLHGVQTIYTYDGNKAPDILGSLDLTATQVAQATTFFQQALLPHPMWLGPLPVCLAEHHRGKVRRLRLVLAALTHLTKAEIASLREGPHLPGGTVLHDLVYGYAVDASLEPEWLVITDGQQPGRWRLLHNSSGPGQRCSVGSSLRYQPSPSTREQRSAQDYTFEALHRVYFYDAWRVTPVLDSPESELVLPPQPGLLAHGCYWPRPSLAPDVLSVSDRDPDKEEHKVQEEQSLSSLAATDAAMADDDANEAVSVHSSSSESPTIPSTEQPEEDDAQMDSANISSEDEGDCLSNRPALPGALTSGLRVAMSRTGWNLLSPRYMLTKVPSAILSNYYCHGYPFTPKMEDRPYNQYGPLLYSEGRWDSSVHGSLGIPSLEVSSQATSRRLGTTWATVRKPLTQVIKLAVLSLLQEREAPRLQQGLPVTAGLPHRRPMGGGSRAVSSKSLPTQ